MSDYYNPETNSAPLWNNEKRLFDTKGCTHKDDMPEASRQWFERPAREGFEWKCLNGKYPEEIPIQPPNSEEIIEIERHWRNSEISITDRCFAPDWGAVDWSPEVRQTNLDKILEYRRLLKTGPNHQSFPDQVWRPQWPEGVPRPVV